MVELFLMTLPVLGVVSVTFARKKIMIDEELLSGSPSNYVLSYYAASIVFNVVVVELVGARPTKYGCMPNWPSATVPVVFLVLGCACLLWVFLCYLRIYRRMSSPAQQWEIQWLDKQQRITFITLMGACMAMICYLPNISAVIILYLDQIPPPGLRVIQFSARLLLGLIDPILYGIGIPSIRKRTMWGINEQKHSLSGRVHTQQVNQDSDSDMCYFPINQTSSREQMDPLSSNSFSAKERSSFEQPQREGSEKGEKSRHSQIVRGSPNLTRPTEPFHDEGRSDIIWSHN